MPALISGETLVANPLTDSAMVAVIRAETLLDARVATL
jgi:hypothetical protein